MFALNISKHYEENSHCFYDTNAYKISKTHKVPAEIQIYNLNCSK